MARILVLLALSLATPVATAAEVAPPVAAREPVLRAVAGVFPPFVMEEHGKLTGFSIDLWNAVAARLGVRTTWQVAPDTPAAFEALRSGAADVVVTGHFYTEERDREFDFTYSILNAGQQVMVRSGVHDEAAHPLRSYLNLLFSRHMIYWFASAVLLLLVPAHLIWLLDRRRGEIVPPGSGYAQGVLHAMSWAGLALFSQAPEIPRRLLARAFAFLWVFAGVLFVSLLVAQLTAAITVERIRGVINGPDDLAGKAVATQAGSTSVVHLRQAGARIEEFASPEEALDALLSRRVDAVVLAAPALQYYESHQGAGRAHVVGPQFKKSDLGFMVSLHSPLRRRIDSALVSLREDGTWERLREKWFGRE